MGKTMKELLAEKEKQMRAEFERAASKDRVMYGPEARKNGEISSEERQEIGIFFKALASGDRTEIQRSNDIQVKRYEAVGKEWRTDAEIKTKAQTVGTVGTGTSGGVLVPTYLRDQIIAKQHYISPMRQISTVINDMPASWDLPYDSALPSTYWVGEGTAGTDSGATFNKKNLQPSKLMGLDSFTSESLADTASSPELQQLVVDRFATALALAENAAFTSGTGSGQPFGFRSSDISPTVLATNSAAGNLAFADVVQQYFTLPTAYRGRAVWVTSSDGVQLLDSIKDGNGRPIFQNGWAGNADADLVPGTLYRRPLYIVDEIPTNLGAGTNETQLWFADFKDYFIGFRGALRIDYGTNGTDFSQDKLTLRIIERVAARPFLDEAWTTKNIK